MTTPLHVLRRNPEMSAPRPSREGQWLERADASGAALASPRNILAHGHRTQAVHVSASDANFFARRDIRRANAWSQKHLKIEQERSTVADEEAKNSVADLPAVVAPAPHAWESSRWTSQRPVLPLDPTPQPTMPGVDTGRNSGTAQQHAGTCIEYLM